MGEQVAARLKQNKYLRKQFQNGGVAQLGEHLPCKQGVKSSNLSISIHQRNLMQKLGSVMNTETICTLKTSYRFDDKKNQKIQLLISRHPRNTNKRKCLNDESQNAAKAARQLFLTL